MKVIVIYSFLFQSESTWVFLQKDNFVNVTKTVQVGVSCTHESIVNMRSGLVIRKSIYSLVDRVLSINTEF